MALRPRQFKRIVLGMQPSTADRTLQLAVEFAGLLHLDLLGLLLEEMDPQHLAAIPFARELRLPGGIWQPVDVDRLTHELEVASRNARRKFAQAAERLSLSHEFETVRGAVAETIAAIARAGDIVVVGEPASPADRATRQFSSLLEAAFSSSPATIFVPASLARTSGPIVAISASQNDASIAAAAAIAMAAKEQLIIVAADEDGEEGTVDELAMETGLSVKRITVGKTATSTGSALLHALHKLDERLIVVSRDADGNERAMAIAAARRTAILVVEPTDAKQGDRI